MSTDKRRRVPKACVYCHRSHLMCDQSRPCKRCVDRNVAHLCRDEDEDLHSLYNKLRAQIRTFHAEFRSTRAKEGLLEPRPNAVPPSRIGVSVLGDSEQVGSRYMRSNNIYDGVVATDGFENLDQTKISLDYLGAFSELPDVFGCEDSNQTVFGVGGDDDTSNKAIKKFDSDKAVQAIVKQLDKRIQTTTSKYWHRFNYNTLNVIEGLKKTMEREGNLDPHVFALCMTKVLKYYEGSYDLHTYLKGRVSDAELERLEEAVTPIRERFLERLTLCKHADMLELNHIFERQVVSLRKYFMLLGLPAMIWRRSGQLVLVTDDIGDILGYRREELLIKKRVYELIPDYEVVDFIVKCCIPQQGGEGNIRCMVSRVRLTRKDGSLLRTRCSLTAVRGRHDIPLCMVAIFLPLDDPFPWSVQPSCEVVSSNTVEPQPAYPKDLYDKAFLNTHHASYNIPSHQRTVPGGSQHRLYNNMDPSAGLTAQEMGTLLTF
ncbi:hypothetical protein SARC_08609 [Sphaeroforma arctica JP610]|uniref:Zn(2)-C6 fungal-type domain-containing protein n=1 Tax=Sphaeroforma arctica JP610 TaxID=667725 RepID=A0A0L0FQJ9_9EUKA|nr:hypothetical protein SARC_08609 [Sphaeroforma arctica JP610]KNC78979.1 hypothetical protein SARC_08609 [Sphaeroforma arctica JP610]|eukprot:XP_014152881.1 hypothetical protein SARC_08609 [Sphaeroforma arctica JP610]